MSTITREFTKEQLKNTVLDEIVGWRCAIVKAPDNAKYHQWLRLAEITLASLDAPLVGYIDAEYANLLNSGALESCSVYAEPGEGCIAVYGAPAALVVPQDSAVESFATDLMKRIDRITGERYSVATLSALRVSIVEACRAAMQSVATTQEVRLE